MKVFNLLDLFSGIGGFSLGLERSGGFKTVAFCEIEPFPRRVLAKHWPGVPIYEDVKTLTKARLDADGISVDAICGGFPCQDISTAGKGAGIEGQRSGPMWSEYARIIGEFRPQVVVVENVAMLLGRGLDRVLGDLAALGYDAEWHCIPAAAVGAPHRRDRIWIVGYAGCQQWSQIGGECRTEISCGPSNRPRNDGPFISDSDKPRLERWLRNELQECARQRAAWKSGSYDADSEEKRLERSEFQWQQDSKFQRSSNKSWWFIEPDVGRVADGVSSRVDRLKGLGNAVVPQIPEIIGRAIMSAGL